MKLEILRWFDHITFGAIKGINLLNCMYYLNEVSFPTDLN